MDIHVYMASLYRFWINPNVSSWLEHQSRLDWPFDGLCAHRLDPLPVPKDFKLGATQLHRCNAQVLRLQFYFSKWTKSCVLVARAPAAMCSVSEMSTMLAADGVN